MKDLKSLIIELRNQLEKTSYEKKEAIQKEREAATTEINQLKNSCLALREELSTLNFEKKQAVQDAILKSADEISELMRSTQKLRVELEQTINKSETSNRRF